MTTFVAVPFPSLPRLLTTSALAPLAARAVELAGGAGGADEIIELDWSPTVFFSDQALLRLLLIEHMLLSSGFRVRHKFGLGLPSAVRRQLVKTGFVSLLCSNRFYPPGQNSRGYDLSPLLDLFTPEVAASQNVLLPIVCSVSFDQLTDDSPEQMAISAHLASHWKSDIERAMSDLSTTIPCIADGAFEAKILQQMRLNVPEHAFAKRSGAAQQAPCALSMARFATATEYFEAWDLGAKDLATLISKRPSELMLYVESRCSTPAPWVVTVLTVDNGCGFYDRLSQRLELYRNDLTRLLDKQELDAFRTFVPISEDWHKAARCMSFAAWSSSGTSKNPHPDEPKGLTSMLSYIRGDAVIAARLCIADTAVGVTFDRDADKPFGTPENTTSPWCREGGAEISVGVVVAPTRTAIGPARRSAKVTSAGLRALRLFELPLCRFLLPHPTLNGLAAAAWDVDKSKLITAFRGALETGLPIVLSFEQVPLRKTVLVGLVQAITDALRPVRQESRQALILYALSPAEACLIRKSLQTLSDELDCGLPVIVDDYADDVRWLFPKSALLQFTRSHYSRLDVPGKRCKLTVFGAAETPSAALLRVSAEELLASGTASRMTPLGPDAPAILAELLRAPLFAADEQAIDSGSRRFPHTPAFTLEAMKHFALAKANAALAAVVDGSPIRSAYPDGLRTTSGLVVNTYYRLHLMADHPEATSLINRLARIAGEMLGREASGPVCIAGCGVETRWFVQRLAQSLQTEGVVAFHAVFERLSDYGRAAKSLIALNTRVAIILADVVGTGRHLGALTLALLDAGIAVKGAISLIDGSEKGMHIAMKKAGLDDLPCFSMLVRRIPIHTGGSYLDYVSPVTGAVKQRRFTEARLPKYEATLLHGGGKVWESLPLFNSPRALLDTLYACQGIRIGHHATPRLHSRVQVTVREFLLSPAVHDSVCSSVACYIAQAGIDAIVYPVSSDIFVIVDELRRRFVAKGPEGVWRPHHGDRPLAFIAAHPSGTRDGRRECFIDSSGLKALQDACSVLVVDDGINTGDTLESIVSAVFLAQAPRRSSEGNASQLHVIAVVNRLPRPTRRFWASFEARFNTSVSASWLMSLYPTPTPPGECRLCQLLTSLKDLQTSPGLSRYGQTFVKRSIDQYQGMERVPLGALSADTTSSILALLHVLAKGDVDAALSEALQVDANDGTLIREDMSCVIVDLCQAVLDAGGTLVSREALAERLLTIAARCSRTDSLLDAMLGLFVLSSDAKAGHRILSLFPKVAQTLDRWFPSDPVLGALEVVMTRALENLRRAAPEDQHLTRVEALVDGLSALLSPDVSACIALSFNWLTYAARMTSAGVTRKGSVGDCVLLLDAMRDEQPRTHINAGSLLSYCRDLLERRTRGLLGSREDERSLDLAVSQSEEVLRGLCSAAGVVGAVDPAVRSVVAEATARTLRWLPLRTRRDDQSYLESYARLRNAIDVWTFPLPEYDDRSLLGHLLRFFLMSPCQIIRAIEPEQPNIRVSWRSQEQLTQHEVFGPPDGARWLTRLVAQLYSDASARASGPCVQCVWEVFPVLSRHFTELRLIVTGTAKPDDPPLSGGLAQFSALIEEYGGRVWPDSTKLHDYTCASFLVRLRFRNRT